MAYGRSNTQQLIKEMLIEVGTYASPQSTTAANPISSSGWVSSGAVGYELQGSIDAQITRAYATLMSGTPQIKIRKDLITKEWIWNAQMTQYNADLLELIMGLDVLSGVWEVGFIGSDEVLQPFNGYLGTTERVDGAVIYQMMFYGKQTGEAVGPKTPGTAHSTYDFKAESFVHPLLTTGSDSRNYGAFIIGPTPSS